MASRSAITVMMLAGKKRLFCFMCGDRLKDDYSLDYIWNHPTCQACRHEARREIIKEYWATYAAMYGEEFRMWWKRG